MKFLGHCRYPKFFEIQIVHEFGVLCDGFFGHMIDDTIAHLFNIDNVVNLGDLYRARGIVYTGGAVNATLMT
jgi:hypothetical protein